MNVRRVLQCAGGGDHERKQDRRWREQLARPRVNLEQEHRERHEEQNHAEVIAEGDGIQREEDRQP